MLNTNNPPPPDLRRAKEDSDRLPGTPRSGTFLSNVRTKSPICKLHRCTAGAPTSKNTDIFVSVNSLAHRLLYQNEDFSGSKRCLLDDQTLVRKSYMEHAVILTND